jgi:hypothetical protein
LGVEEEIKAVLGTLNSQLKYQKLLIQMEKKLKKLRLEWSMSDQLSKLCQTALFSIQDGHYINRNYFN